MGDMEPFNYDEWKKNPKRKVVTRFGADVSDIHLGAELTAPYPIYAMVGSERLSFTLDGLNCIGAKLEDDLFFADEQQQIITKLKWRKCKAGYKFSSDAIVIPDDERTTDRDPRLVRCAIWDSKYILIDELKKLPVDNG